MLDVIGAGATVTSAQDWHTIWNASPEAAYTTKEINTIQKKGQNGPAVTAELHSEFATSWVFQAKELLAREVRAYYRDPPPI